jgi:DNA excision repair protein ERCC-3
VHQWMREIVARTSLGPDQVGEYTGGKKEILPVTVSTYQILTSRRSGDGGFAHMRLFNERDWGLVIYDEVHLLPAPVFRVTAEIQARRRLGLTATLVREDGREDDVFALIGPKRHDVPWRELESQGWIATAECCELRVDLPDALRTAYSVVDGRERFRLAAENPVKDELAAHLVATHPGERILVLGHYLNQLKRLAERLRAPLLTGKTPQAERERRFEAFRKGEEPVLVVSRVANFAVDLPEASVAIEVSGLFGSRQEEAQRLGRVLRPKADGRPARFFALVSRDTDEQEYASRRQLFLAEQGYRYTIRVAEAVARADAEGGAREDAAPRAPAPPAAAPAAATGDGSSGCTQGRTPGRSTVVPFRPRGDSPRRSGRDAR